MNTRQYNMSLKRDSDTSVSVNSDSDQAACGVTQKQTTKMKSRPWIRGVTYAPNGDFYCIDSSNDMVLKYSRTNSPDGGYQEKLRRKLPASPRDVTYIESFMGSLHFRGLVITMEGSLMVFLLAPNLDACRLMQTKGNYSGISAVPSTNLLVVVNSVTSSVDVINVDGVLCHSYRMPAEIDAGNGYIAVSMQRNKPVFILSSSSGLICMSLDWLLDVLWLKPVDVVLRSIQRYVPPQDEPFTPVGVAVYKDQVFVADRASDRIVRFRLCENEKYPELFFLSRLTEHPCKEPIGVDVTSAGNGTIEIGIGRQKGNPPHFHLLKFIFTSFILEETGD